MKKLFSLALLSLALPAHAIINGNDNVPAATLLLPYFDVDTNNASGTRTVFTVGNVSANEVLAHVTLWTDRGVPTINFNMRLAGRDMVEIDLRDVIVNGTLPASTVGGFGASCTGQLPPANLTPTQITGLRNAHTGLGSSLLGNQCGAKAYGDGHARGYVTVDAVSACTNLVPGDATYFVSGGTGIATNANVLWGERSIHNATTGAAYGDTMVHIEASATDMATNGILDATEPGPDYTFYGRRIGFSGADNREALSRTYIGRYSFRAPIDGTVAQIWRDPGLATAFSCASPPPGLATLSIGVFDHQEQLSSSTGAALPLATQEVNLANPLQARVPFLLGMMYYDLGLPAPMPLLPTERNQGFVSHVLTSAGGSSAGQTGAWAVWPITQYEGNILQFQPFSQCDDGEDNDGDGDTDFPADDGCPTADWPTESPQCDDGISNDADGLVDFPADPGCFSAASNFEAPECDDGVDNSDTDLLIDHPADPECFARSDVSEEENLQCGDGIDNDGDGLIDFREGFGDPNCNHPFDDLEAAGICSDGIDNDGDGRTDFPSDLGCTGPTDSSEVNPVCIDGIDNDGDGQTDYPADTGCPNANGSTEAPECSDGINNDADAFIDFPADVGCASPSSNDESPECNDGNDNDLDGFTDFPADPSCLTAASPSEYPEACGDGRDNDGDGLIDFPLESGCTSLGDPFEGPDCSDVMDLGGGMTQPIDNDGDGLANFPTDPGCSSAVDENELAGTTTRSCSDGLDNDGDGFVDYPLDAGCSSANDDVEFQPGEAQGNVAPVPTLSQWGMMLAAVLMLLAGAAGLRRRLGE